MSTLLAQLPYFLLTLAAFGTAGIFVIAVRKGIRGRAWLLMTAAFIYAQREVMVLRYFLDLSEAEIALKLQGTILGHLLGQRAAAPRTGTQGRAKASDANDPDVGGGNY